MAPTILAKIKDIGRIMKTLRLLLLSSICALTLIACGNDTPAPTETNTPPVAPTGRNIVGLINIMDYAQISATKSFIRIKLTGTHKISGSSVDYATTLLSNLHTQNFGFSLPSPNVINPDINYGISLELVTGASHPGFTAWYPLDLNHYKGELLSTRLFPLNSSTLVNYQVSAMQCGPIKTEVANDNSTMWINANGSGYFLTKAEDENYTSPYAKMNRNTNTLSLGEHSYTCETNNKASSLAKKRFSGALFHSISRKDGWAITVYNRTLRLVSRRGLKTELKALPNDIRLNDQWSLRSSDATVTVARNNMPCENNMQAIDVTIDDHNYTACGQKLR